MSFFDDSIDFGIQMQDVSTLGVREHDERNKERDRAARNTANDARLGLLDFGSEVEDFVGEEQSSLQEILDDPQFSQFQKASVDTSGFDAFTQAGLGGIQQAQAGAGTQDAAIQQYQGLLDDPSSILNDPLVQAQRNQGIDAAELGAAAGGTQLSGGQMRELQDFGQTFAGTQIDKGLGRFAGLAQLGAQQQAGGQQSVSLGQQSLTAGLGIQNQLAQSNLAGLANFNSQRLQGASQSSNLGLAGLGMRNDILNNNLASLTGQAINASNTQSGDRAQTAQLIGTVVSAFSDRRLKTDITPTGDKLSNGLPLYSFKYIWDDKTSHIGLMADEVEKVIPEAITVTPSGFMKVDYSMVGV